MKKMQYLLLALLLSTGSLIAGTAKDPVANDPSPLKAEIQELFSRSPIQRDLVSEVVVRVEVVVNQNNELVVLRTDCDDEQFKNYIREKLNYQRIGCRIENRHGKFIVPIRFKKD